MLSAIYARSSVAADEKKKVLGSLKYDPDRKQARAIRAGKLLERSDSLDVRELYEKIKEGKTKMYSRNLAAPAENQPQRQVWTDS